MKGSVLCLLLTTSYKLKMKKIGIITLSASDNCGSLLQTFALQSVLKERYGYDVEIINFISRESDRVYRMFPDNFYLHPKKTFFTIKHFLSIYRQRKGYQLFRERYLNLTQEIYTNVEKMQEICNNYDVLIAGSDQVWNINMADFSTAFFLPWKGTARKIAYAASLGATKNILGKEKNRIKLWLEDFYAVSVRETMGKSTLEDLGIKNISVTADPTLLVSQETWNEILPERLIESEYIFYYSWSYPDKEMHNLVREFGKSKKLDVYVINSSKWYNFRPKDFCFKLYKDSGPLVFLNLMKHAKYVFVQSFHGVVFANIFKKSYFLLNEKENGAVDFRIQHLITSLCQQNRIVHDMAGINNSIDSEINFSSEEFLKLIRTSFEFMDKNIL